MKTTSKRTAEDPLAGDLSGFLATLKFRPTSIELEKKDTSITLRLPASLVASAKALAKRQGVRYQGLMRSFIADGVARGAWPGSPMASDGSAAPYPKAKRKKRD